jgi:putative tryptophan/tyrosine transport system substrate-binding protein
MNRYDALFSGDAMRRREFITLASAASVLPLVARAQQKEQMRRVGLLMGFAETDPNTHAQIKVLREALAKLGWVEGNNFQIELRWGAADPSRIMTFAKELVSLRPDVILGQTTPVISALASETQIIPIVFVNISDPISSGFVTSLARPDKNMTGFGLFESGMGGKWVERLKQIAPRTAHIALLFNPTTTVPPQFFMSSIQAAASSFAIEVNSTPVHGSDEIEGVIVAQTRKPGGALIVMPDSFTTTNRELIIALAARHGVPAIYNASVFAKSGGLISYGSDFVEQFRQAAEYIDRILKGAKPADLPVQGPTKLELLINLKTAKALGIDVPLHLQQLADDLIE